MTDTGTDGTFRARPVDEAILGELLVGRDTSDPWGRASPGHIAEHIDYSHQHVINRMESLQAAGYIKKLQRGLYEITDAGIAATESD